MEASSAATRGTGRLTRIGTGVALAGALAYVGFADPHRPGFLFPTCPFHVLTGWYCPGCGGLRMTHDVLRGDLAAAVTDNVFLLVALPLLAGWMLIRWKSGRPPLGVSAYAVGLVAVVAWTVVRNWPGFPLVPTLLER